MIKGMRYTELHCECILVHDLLARLPNNVPSAREAKIQNEKLLRMLTALLGMLTALLVESEFERLLADGSIKKLMKRMAKKEEQIERQAKKARQVLYRFFKELFRRYDMPLSNSEYPAWRERIDRDIAYATTKFAHEVVHKQYLATPKMTLRVRSLKSPIRYPDLFRFSENPEEARRACPA